MTALFTRYNDTPFAGTVSLDGKGKPYFMEARKCSRCGGAGGSEKWRHTGWTCFDCGGSGKHRNGPLRVRLYTGNEITKLNAAKAKRDAKRAAALEAKAAAARAEADARREAFLAEHGELLARAEPFRERNAFVGDVVAKVTERCEITENQAVALAAAIERIAAEDAAKAASGYVGTVGKRIETEVTVERVASYERPDFYRFDRVQTVWVVTMRDAAGNAIVSKTPAFAPEKGAHFVLRATVKEHSEYNDEKQTIVQRCAVREQKETA